MRRGRAPGAGLRALHVFQLALRDAFQVVRRGCRRALPAAALAGVGAACEVGSEGVARGLGWIGPGLGPLRGLPALGATRRAFLGIGEGWMEGRPC